MHAISLIKRQIAGIPRGRLFTTRELLLYGTRTAVDQALSKLVRDGWIVRLARGVFVKSGSDVARISVDDIARVKAESFGKQIVTWAGNLAFRLGRRLSTPPAPIYSVSGSSSSFKFGDLKIELRKLCPRKLRLAASAAGQLLSVLWQQGKAEASRLASDFSLLPQLDRLERDEIRLSAIWLPAWLSDKFVAWRLPPAVIWGRSRASEQAFI